MKMTIITVGKIKEKYLRDAIAEYTTRLSRYCTWRSSKSLMKRRRTRPAKQWKSRSAIRKASGS